jgi:sugar phosphate isomerase/epimerase
MTGKPRIGVSQLVWGYDLSRPDRWVQFLDEASEIGYEGILAFDSTLPFWYNRPAELKRMLDQRKLALAAVIHRPSLDFLGTRRLAKFVKELGGERLVLSGRDGRAEDWAVSLPLIQRHGEVAAEEGLRLVYHHHTGWLAESMEQYERLLAETDRRYVGAMVDCGHAARDFVGHTPQEFILKHPEIEYVELKGHGPEGDLSLEVGRGVQEWPAIADALRTIGYTGWIVVEQNQTSRTPKESAAESLRYIRETLGLGVR